MFYVYIHLSPVCWLSFVIFKILDIISAILTTVETKKTTSKLLWVVHIKPGHAVA
jgi:hypothetical protein